MVYKLAQQEERLDIMGIWKTSEKSGLRFSR